MQHTNCTKARLCLLSLSLSAISLSCYAGESIQGGIYTFISSTPVQLSTIIGTANVNTISLTVQSGMCGKVQVGSSSTMNTLGAGTFKNIFPTACSGPLDNSVGLVEDGWSIDDYLQNADGVVPGDYWLLGGSGSQVAWKTLTTGLAATKLLRLVGAALAYQGGPNPSTVGASRVEINVIPGADWKVLVCTVISGDYADHCFYDMYPQYYLSNGQITLPTPPNWTYKAKTMNANTSSFVIDAPNTNGSGTAYMGVWKYQ